MPATVYFATNRVLNGPPDRLQSYGASVVAPANPTVVTYGTAFVEYRPTAKWTITAGAENLTNDPNLRHRNFYQPDRTQLAPYLYEERYRNPHVLLYVTVKRSFG